MVRRGSPVRVRQRALLKPPLPRVSLVQARRAPAASRSIDLGGVPVVEASCRARGEHRERPRRSAPTVGRSRGPPSALLAIGTMPSTTNTAPARPPIVRPATISAAPNAERESRPFGLTRNSGSTTRERACADTTGARDAVGDPLGRAWRRRRDGDTRSPERAGTAAVRETLRTACASKLPPRSPRICSCFGTGSPSSTR